MLACQAVARELLKELQAWKQARFTEWNEVTMDKLGSIKMDQSGKLIDMDSLDGRIKLHYNEDLVVLLREVRQCWQETAQHMQIYLCLGRTASHPAYHNNNA